MTLRNKGKIKLNQNLKDTNFFSYRISCRGINNDAELAREYIASGQRGKYMACVNPHSLVVASRDSLFDVALRKADILIPDGAGIVLASKILHLPIKERVAGNDFFLALSNIAEKDGGYRYFFLGSKSYVLKKIEEKMKIDYPLITICGAYSPPYKEMFDENDNKVIIDLINKACPDVLWVGMTAPKQEKWIFQNKGRLNVPFIGAIGAVFDFYSGTRKRPSPLWQKFCLEWLGRLINEPGRLWKRNIISMPIFSYWVLKEKILTVIKRNA